MHDYRSTLNEIINVNQHGASPRDKGLGDPDDYGKLNAQFDCNTSVDK